ncbi:hypothetical protein EDD86DRAFT_215233 [Gorgonomyces haynaldii]|nr:hypothetical protein EDD86DRAFT_215233 [Gorgonomyces haynaldii]
MADQGNRFYKYPSAVFHGLAYAELATCVLLLAQKLMSEKSVWKTPIFIVCVLSVLVNMMNLGLYGEIMFELITYHGAATSVYDVCTNIIIFSLQIPVILNHIVILIRMDAFTDRKSVQFMVISGLAVIHLFAVIGSYVFGSMSFTEKLFYESKAYRPFILCSGLAILLDSTINVLSTVLFVKAIGKLFSVPTRQLILEIMYNHQGGRWIVVILSSIFFAFALIYTLIAGGANNVIATAYHVTPWANFLVLCTFIQFSYVTTKQVLKTHTVASRFKSNASSSAD